MKPKLSNKPFLEGLIQLAAAFRMYSDFGESQRVGADDLPGADPL